MRPGDYRTIQGTVDSLRARQRERRERRTALAEALDVELARTDDYREASVRDAQRELAAADAELARVTERLTQVERRLPSDAARAEAARQAEALRAEADRANDRLDAAWGRLRELLAPAEEAAREIGAAREALRRPTGQLAELSATMGLDVPAPRPAEPAKDERELVRLIGMLIGETAYGLPRDVVLRELRNARVKTRV